MKWQNYWWRALMLQDKGYEGWQPLGPDPMSQVPNSALARMSLEECVAYLLEDVADSFREMDAEVRVECFTVPDPGPDDVPVYSAQMRTYDA
ncbi:hypothetical protein GCM10010452_47670 [Crossiella cryophila]